MESFKIENYQRDHPGDQFPFVEPLSEPKTQDLRARIRMHLGLGPGADELSLVRKIAQAATHLNGVDAQAGDFDLSELLKRLNIRAMPRAYVNWYRFDRVDALWLNDLSDHFDYIWYPGADDIDIFDDSCAWIVSVSHVGDVSLLVLDPGI